MGGEGMGGEGRGEEGRGGERRGGEGHGFLMTLYIKNKVSNHEPNMKTDLSALPRQPLCSS